MLDAAHNPHGAEAAAAALEDSFSFSPLVGVMGVMEDKDDDGVLAAFEPHLAYLVCTQNSTAALDVRRRAGPRPPSRSSARTGSASCPTCPTPSTAAATLAEAGEAIDVSIGSGAVLVTGSVVTVGEARALLKGRR